MENSNFGNTNTLFPYNDIIERQFKLLDSLEKTIPRFTPHLWNKEPHELNTFIAQEQKNREKRSTFVDRWYEDIKKSVEDRFPQCTDNFCTPSFGTMSLEARRKDDENALRALRGQHAPLVNKDLELERYFQNASPIPHVVSEEEVKPLCDDYVRGIPFIQCSVPVSEEVSPSEETSFQYQDDPLRKSEKRDYRMALATGTPVEKEIKRQEENRQKKESLKQKRLMKKFNEGFIVHETKTKKNFRSQHSKKKTAKKENISPLSKDFLNFPKMPSKT